MSLFDANEILEIEGLLDEVHSAFSRPINYYQTKEETVLVTNEKHNFLFQSAPQNTTTQKVEKSGTINARILHGRKHDLSTASYEAKSIYKVLLQDGEIRIKVDAAGHEILKKTKRIIVDNFTCEVFSTGRPIGPFSRKFYSYTLKPIN